MPTNARDIRRITTVIDSASGHARTIFYLYIGYISYCAVTVFGTTDRQLLIKGERVSLPLLDITVSLYGFFLLAPIIAIAIYIYFMIHLNRLNILIDDLITYNKDRHYSYSNTDLYPWLFNIARFPDKGWIGKIQYFFAFVSLWLSLPLIIAIFFSKFMKKHDEIFSYLFVLLFFVCIFIVLMFWYEYSKIISRSNLKKRYIPIILILLLLSCGAVTLINQGYFGAAKYPRYDVWVNMNLRNQILVTPPPQEEELEQKYWLDISGSNLNGADLNNSVLKRANMSRVKLINADLQFANLNEANLSYSNLKGVMLNMNEIVEAKLLMTDLSGSKIWFADFSNSDLQMAKLYESEIMGSKLDHANLNSADIRNAEVSGSSLRMAKLTFSKLQNTEFIYLDLEKADLSFADLHNASFVVCNLHQTNLRRTKGATKEMLCKAGTLYEAKIDSALLNEIMNTKNGCPEKLTKESYAQWLADNKKLPMTWQIYENAVEK